MNLLRRAGVCRSVFMALSLAGGLLVAHIASAQITDDYKFTVSSVLATEATEPDRMITLSITMVDETPGDNAGATSFDLNSITYPHTTGGGTGMQLTGVALGADTTASGTDPVHNEEDGWSIDWSELTLGTIDIALAKQSGGAGHTGATAVEIAKLTFHTDLGVIYDTVLPASVVASDTWVNGSLSTGTNVDGVVRVVGVYQGDVSGDGDITSRDASLTLQSVVETGTARPLTEPNGAVFPIRLTAPAIWGTLPAGRLATAVGASAGGTTLAFPPTSAAQNQYTVFDVADVNEDLAIGATDASMMLQFAVGIVTSFGGADDLPPAPSFITNAGNLFRTSSTSERPDAQITVSLDMADLPNITSGELRMDYDRAVLRPVGVTIDSEGEQPLLAHSTKAGDLGIAFAAARPIEGATLRVVFEAAPEVSGAARGYVRARDLVLNGTRIATEFFHTFPIESYRFDLMANYPNPFNPETWIPYELGSDSEVTIRIYGLDGTEVRTLNLGMMPQGVYSSRDEAAYWDGRNNAGERVASGVYVYDLTAGDYHATRRMAIRK